MADHAGIVTAGWGALTVDVVGSDARFGVVDCAWGALTITVDTAPENVDGTVVCVWGE